MLISSTALISYQDRSPKAIQNRELSSLPKEFLNKIENADHKGQMNAKFFHCLFHFRINTVHK